MPIIWSQPSVEPLEPRNLPAVTVSLTAGVLSILGGPNRDRIDLLLDAANAELVVQDSGIEVTRFASAGVASIDINAGAGPDTVTVAPAVAQPTVIDGGDGNDALFAGGGPTTLIGGLGNDRLYGSPVADALFGGDGSDKLFGNGGNDNLDGGAGKDLLDGGPGADSLDGGPDADIIQGDTDGDIALGGDAADRIFGAAGDDFLAGENGDDKLFGDDGDDLLSGGPGNDVLSGGLGLDIDVDTGAILADAIDPPPAPLLAPADVSLLLDRASAATPSQDAIIAIVDRNGRILGVRVEAGVSSAITGNPDALTFAIDGAVAKARTGAFFANNQAPLTSRTVQFISQTTITQREVESNPSITDESSPVRGPGFVAPVGINGHFPPDVQFTPQVDLFAIEHTNRDSIVHPSTDRIKGTADDVLLPARFNIDPNFIPFGVQLFPPISYGEAILTDAQLAASGVRKPQARGIATLPGGIPIYKGGGLVGGIGVFFPGATGFATEEQSTLNDFFDPLRPDRNDEFNPPLADRSQEAEYIAFAALGGSTKAAFSLQGPLGNAPALPLNPDGSIIFDLPFGRIDLVGVTLDIFGPGGNRGIDVLKVLRRRYGEGVVNGTNRPVNAGGDLFLAGLPVSEGWLVMPHDGLNITADEVTRIIVQGITQANQTRAAIRLPLGSRTKMILAVTDTTGEVLGLFRMPDATVFSIDVAVAKARNVAYYADPTALQPIDQIAGVPAGAAFTNRTFRFVALPHFPEGIDGLPPGPFSILNDGGSNPAIGVNDGPPLPASAFQSVLGFDAFHPGTNFRDPGDPGVGVLNQNGIIFFPGSSPLYKDLNGDGRLELVGGFGISGDGVDQDDVVTAKGDNGFQAPSGLRADQFFVRGVRLPFQKFNRNPEG